MHSHFLKKKTSLSFRLSVSKWVNYDFVKLGTESQSFSNKNKGNDLLCWELIILNFLSSSETPGKSSAEPAVQALRQEALLPRSPGVFVFFIKHTEDHLLALNAILFFYSFDVSFQLCSAAVAWQRSWGLVQKILGVIFKIIWGL